VSDRAARVERVLAIGARIADENDSLGKSARSRLFETSGLSREGVELALSEHLERGATTSELAAFVASAAEATACHVVLSANVCTASLRAIAFALATSTDVVVAPSRRDPVIAEIVVAALAVDLELGAQVRLAELGEKPSKGELHIYGADETIAAIRRAAQDGVLVRGHGSGLGAAIVDGAADLDAAAAALARDVVPFDQAGCLSPRFALVGGGPEKAERFAKALDRELGALGQKIPRGVLDVSTRAELARYRAAMQAIGSFEEGRHHAVGFDPTPRALVLAPAARVVHVVAAEGETLEALLAPFTNALTTIGTESERLSRAWPCRVTELGKMQKPPFDGPVDLRPYRRRETE
jgi:hypothetical protein